MSDLDARARIADPVKVTAFKRSAWTFDGVEIERNHLDRPAAIVGPAWLIAIVAWFLETQRLAYSPKPGQIGIDMVEAAAFMSGVGEAIDRAIPRLREDPDLRAAALAVIELTPAGEVASVVAWLHGAAR